MRAMRNVLRGTIAAASAAFSAVVLSVSSVAATEFSIDGMLYGQTLDGVLDSVVDYRQSDDYGDEYIMDNYWFEGLAGEQVVITLHSVTFDSYLLLFDVDGTDALAENDNFSGTDAQLSLTLPASGRYLISATSAFPLETGSYQLTLTRIEN